MMQGLPGGSGPLGGGRSPTKRRCRWRSRDRHHLHERWSVQPVRSPRFPPATWRRRCRARETARADEFDDADLVLGGAVCHGLEGFLHGEAGGVRVNTNVDGYRHYLLLVVRQVL